MNLFDELAADAKKDIDSGKFLNQENNGGVDAEVSKAVEDMESRINETLNNAVKKINDTVDAATGVNNNNVPNETDDEPENNDSEVK